MASAADAQGQSELRGALHRACHVLHRSLRHRTLRALRFEVSRHFAIIITITITIIITIIITSIITIILTIIIAIIITLIFTRIEGSRVLDRLWLNNQQWQDAGTICVAPVERVSLYVWSFTRWASSSVCRTLSLLNNKICTACAWGPDSCFFLVGND